MPWVRLHRSNTSRASSFPPSGSPAFHLSSAKLEQATSRSERFAGSEIANSDGLSGSLPRVELANDVGIAGSGLRAAPALLELRSPPQRSRGTHQADQGSQSPEHRSAILPAECDCMVGFEAHGDRPHHDAVLSNRDRYGRCDWPVWIGVRPQKRGDRLATLPKITRDRRPACERGCARERGSASRQSDTCGFCSR